MSGWQALTASASKVPWSAWPKVPFLPSEKFVTLVLHMLFPLPSMSLSLPTTIQVIFWDLFIDSLSLTVRLSKRPWSPTSSLPVFLKLGATVREQYSLPPVLAPGNTSWVVIFSCFASSTVEGSRDGTFQLLSLGHPLGAALSGHQGSLVSWSAVLFYFGFFFSFCLSSGKDQLAQWPPLLRITQTSVLLWLLSLICSS